VNEKKKWFFFSNNTLEKKKETKCFFYKHIETKERIIESSVPCNVMDVNSDMYGLDKNSFNESAYPVNDNQSIPIYADVKTYPCSNCGRCFNVESLVNLSIILFFLLFLKFSSVNINQFVKNHHKNHLEKYLMRVNNVRQIPMYLM